jgi:hypothetical protein
MSKNSEKKILGVHLDILCSLKKKIVEKDILCGLRKKDKNMSRESYFGSPKIVFFYTAHKNVIYL